MKGYESHESFWTDVRMFLNMLKVAFLICLTLQAVYFLYGFYQSFSVLKNAEIIGQKIPVASIIKYYSYYPSGNVVVENKFQFLFRTDEVPVARYKEVLNRFTDYAFDKFEYSIKTRGKKSLKIYYFLIIYFFIFYLKSRLQAREKYIRGTDFLTIKQLTRRLKKSTKKDKVKNLRIGQGVLPRNMETAHMLILGASGAGKSVLLNQLFYQINQRKSKENPEKAVVYDMKGEFIEKHYTPNDYIFCPFDQRTIAWSFFNEIKSVPDFDVIAKSLYVSTDLRNEYWYNCAKDVFRTGLIYLYINKKTKNKDIWEFFSNRLDNIKDAFLTLPLNERGALKHIDKEDSNASANIISILQERIQFFRYLIGLDGDFCFKDYIRNQSDMCNLYLLNIDAYKNIFKPLMSLAVDTMIRELLSLSDDSNRRIFFIIDELGTLYKLESVLDLITIGRSKGGPLICANQDLGRLEETYGRSNIKTLFNNFNSYVLFRINEPESADFVSKVIGEQQKIIRSTNVQISPDEFGDRKGFAEQYRMERIIIPSELQSFKDFEAVLKIANYGSAKIKIPQVFYKKINPHFVMKDFTIETDEEKGLREELKELKVEWF